MTMAASSFLLYVATADLLEKRTWLPSRVNFLVRRHTAVLNAYAAFLPLYKRVGSVLLIVACSASIVTRILSWLLFLAIIVRSYSALFTYILSMPLSFILSMYMDNIDWRRRVAFILNTLELFVGMVLYFVVALLVCGGGSEVAKNYANSE